MKLKNLITLSFAIFALTVFSFAQEEQAEAPMFGTTRSFSHAAVHNFKTVSGDAVSYQFTIENKGKTNLKIMDIKIPEKVGVTIVESTIKPGKQGIILATIDPTIAAKGKLKETIVVTTEQKEPGVITTKKIKFQVEAEIK
ncbi:MAG: DUF1573 domain-containing protein [Bacteroidota bacterium]|nr:DUF1573 domain-containing protein [Bacteroidota bacterium]